MKKIIDILKDLHPKYDYEGSDDFISDGLLDSLDLQELFGIIEKEYDIKLAGTDLTPQNFRSIDDIRDLLASHGVTVDG